MSFRPKGEIFLYPRPTLGNENSCLRILNHSRVSDAETDFRIHLRVQ